MVSGVKKFEDFAWVDSKPAYPDRDEMFSQLKKLKHRFYQRELDHMISQKTYTLDIAAKNSNVKPAKKASRIGGWTIFRRDMRAFAEYCIARFIVWRELRRRKKDGR
jgi:hypothetical protein